MMVQYAITLRPSKEHPLYPNAAYRLYAFLLEQLPKEEAQWLHEEGNGEVTQYLQYKKEEGSCLWTVNMLTDRTATVVCPLLDILEKVEIEGCSFPIVEKKSVTMGLSELLEADASQRYQTIRFCTPTAFKQSGRYTIFPQERLILQSLLLHWKQVFPECPLDDPDAFEALLAGVHIIDYKLSTSRYLLKGTRIPGFTGTCTVEAKLAPPLLAVWNALLTFANYAGVGIKTSIGMGGVQTSPSEKNFTPK